MEEMVTIPRKEYEELKRKVEEKESAIKKELDATLDDLKHGRVHEITNPEDI